MNRKHMQSPDPAWHYDRSAAIGRCTRLKFQSFITRSAARDTLRRKVAITLACLTALAVLLPLLWRILGEYAEAFRP